MSEHDLFGDATVVERTFTIERRHTEHEGTERVSYRASLSSETPVPMAFGDTVLEEILDHSDGAIVMDRASRGLPLLWNHDTNALLGRVGNIHIENRRLVGDLTFTPNREEAQRVKADVDAGFLSDISVKYERIAGQREKSDTGERVRLTKWRPLETSILTVPADATVGIDRSHRQTATEGKPMTTETPPNTGDDGVIDIAEFQAARQQGISEGARQATEAERKRVAAIHQTFASLSTRYQTREFDALRGACIDKGSSIEQAQRAILELIGRDPGETPADTAERGPAAPPDRPDTPTPDPRRVSAGQDQREKFLEGATRALEFRLGMVTDREAQREMAQNEFADYSCVELAREALHRVGVRTAGLDKSRVVGYAFRPDLAPQGARAGSLTGHGTSDFANLLENIANKQLLRGYDEAPETWQTIVRITTLPDYKQASRTGLSSFSDLDVVPESGEYKHGTMGDRKELIQALKYGKLFAITREALINDDLSAFGETPMKMGRAASRKVGDIVYDVFNNPPTMNQDATALFRASNTGTSGVLSVTTLDEARKLMALQTDSSSVATGLNIMPRYLIVPRAIETTANVLIASEVDPLGLASATGGAVRPNPFRNAFIVVSDARLDANSAAKWYMTADPNQFDTLEVGFVGGRREPSLESRDGWTVDGIEYKVRHEFGVAALDFRTFIYNAGV